MIPEGGTLAPGWLRRGGRAVLPEVEAATAWLVAASLLSLVWTPSLGAQAAILLVGVALLGAPHGVFDLELLRRAGRGRVLVTGLLTGLYLGLIGMVLAGWALAPGVTLAVFLATAGVHFGLEGNAPGRTVPERLVHVGARGASILTPLVFLSPDTRSLMASLAGTPPGQVDQAIQVGAPWAVGAWLILLLLSAATYVGRRDGRGAAGLAALALLFSLAPALLAFAVYFTGVHSVGHVRRARRLLGPQTPRAGLGWTLAWLAPAVLASVAALAVAGLALGTTAATLQALRLLAALALPHLAMGPWLERRIGVASAGGRFGQEPGPGRGPRRSPGLSSGSLYCDA